MQPENITPVLQHKAIFQNITVFLKIPQGILGSYLLRLKADRSDILQQIVLDRLQSKVSYLYKTGDGCQLATLVRQR